MEVVICASDPCTPHFCQEGKVYKPGTSEGKGNICCASASFRVGNPSGVEYHLHEVASEQRLVEPLEITQLAHLPSSTWTRRIGVESLLLFILLVFCFILYPCQKNNFKFSLNIFEVRYFLIMRSW